MEEIGKEIENVRAGWQWAVEHEKEEEIGKSLESLFLFYERRSWFQEGEEAFGKVVEGLRGVDGTIDEAGEGKGLLLGNILARQGWFCYDLSRLGEARGLLQQSLSILRRLGTRREMAFSLNRLGNVAWRQGEYAEAQQLYQESLAIYKKVGDQRGMAKCLNNLGVIAPTVIASTMGRYAEAKRLFQESLAIYREIGDLWGIAGCLNNLGVIAMLLEEYAEAKQLYQESLTIHKEIGDRQGTAARLTNLGLVAEMLGEYSEAKQLHQEGLAIYREIGDRWGVSACLNNIGFALCALEECQEEVRKCFHEALKTAGEQATPTILYALVGMATLLIKEGEKEQTAEIVAHVLHHPATHEEIRNRAEQLLSELEVQLSPQEFAAAQERGKARELEYYVRVYGPSG